MPRKPRIPIEKILKIKELLNSLTIEEITDELKVSPNSVIKAKNGEYDWYIDSINGIKNCDSAPGEKISIKKNIDKEKKNIIDNINGGLANKNQSVGPPLIDKNKLKKELRILIGCLGYGHKKYKEFPMYKINNSVQLNERIHEIIDILGDD